MVVVALNFFQSLKSWGVLRKKFDGGVKENLVQNILLAKAISWSWAHFYVTLIKFSPIVPLVRKLFRKQTTILPQNTNY